MPAITIQFHTLSEEIAAIVANWAVGLPLFVVKVQTSPKSTKENLQLIDRSEIFQAIEADSNCIRLLFTTTPPHLTVSTSYQFENANPNCLRLDIGRVNQSTLQQSWLVASVDNPDALKPWKQLARKIKQISETGIWAINRQTGERGLARTYRYTEGAKKAQISGIEMVIYIGIGPKLEIPIDK